MDISKFALFASVAETRNFTKSGEKMGYTQPGVSHALKTLETELGFPLFLRTKQGIELTPNAKAILPIIRELLSVNEHLEQVIASINGLDTGHLTIACFASISRNWLPAIIHKFQQQYPGIEIELMEGGTDEIVGWIENNMADFGLLSKRHTYGLEWIPLYNDPLMAILPTDYPVSSSEYFPIEEMHEKTFIISAEGTDYDIHHALQKSGIAPSIRFSCKDDFSIVTMVANHLGISILPQLVIEGFSNSILTLPLKPYYTRELGIGISSRKNLSPAALNFIKILQETLPDLVAPNVKPEQ